MRILSTTLIILDSIIKLFFLFYIKIDHLNFKLVRNRFFVNIFFLSFLVNINTIFLSKNTDFLFRKIMDE
jgi:hypothetical protein